MLLSSQLHGLHGHCLSSSDLLHTTIQACVSPVPQHASPLCSLSGFWFEHAHFVPSDHVSLHTTHWTLADQVVDLWCAIRWCCTLTVQASDRCTHNLSVFLACPFYTIQPTMPPRTATCGSMGACSMLLYLMSTYCTRTCIPQPAVTEPGGCEPCCVPVTLAAIGRRA